MQTKDFLNGHRCMLAKDLSVKNCHFQCSHFMTEVFYYETGMYILQFFLINNCFQNQVSFFSFFFVCCISSHI